MVQILNPGSNKAASERMRRKSEARRLDILRAAARVFRRSGVAAAGMREIAEEADLSPGNLYYYFAGKDELLFFCQDRTLDRMLEAAEVARIRRPGPRPAARRDPRPLALHSGRTRGRDRAPRNRHAGRSVAPDHHRKTRQIRARSARTRCQGREARRFCVLRRGAGCARHPRRTQLDRALVPPRRRAKRRRDCRGAGRLSGARHRRRAQERCEQGGARERSRRFTARPTLFSKKWTYP